MSVLSLLPSSLSQRVKDEDPSKSKKTMLLFKLHADQHQTVYWRGLYRTYVSAVNCQPRWTLFFPGGTVLPGESPPDFDSYVYAVPHDHEKESKTKRLLIVE